VIVREASDLDVLELALIENLQRAELNPVEEAKAYLRLAEEFAMKQDDIARRVGRSRASVANAMRLLDLAPQLQTWLSAGTPHGRTCKGSAVLALSGGTARRCARKFCAKASPSGLGNFGWRSLANLREK
jgi:ParB family chromosome partitioning protein